jgi:hypothetical protein
MQISSDKVLPDRWTLRRIRRMRAIFAASLVRPNRKKSACGKPVA